MKKRLIQLSKIVAVLVFAVGLVLFIQSGIATQAKASKSFVVTYKVSNIEADAKPVVEEIRVKSVKATGEYKQTFYYLQSGRTAEYVATQDSVYEVKTDSLQYFGKALSPELNNNFRSPAFLKNHPNFSREEKICDLTTYVLHTQDGDAWIESYSAIETGNTPLETVLYHGNGGYTVIEAVSVQFRDVSDDEVRLPDLPVKFNKAEQKVDEYRNGGAVGPGNNLKNQIDKKKQQSINL